ncbi:hypothetical protein SAMN04489727_1712 [Amycolatopsis tolypomycina]|uniref:Uncharacterized protein n=1 Tax=Amycolatopsis tolypomycina TaxID=208445 RepID=A0A1H4JBI9_9PSEU|nr:hypothetical protein [Amycolatopsis tolypomycina]SEB43425.1 hypothetical protein SAMN04489727_1712 [Amycolatopsis tolypomycina]
MTEPEGDLPTTWPDWVALTTDRRPLPDPPPDVDEAWTFVYDGECLSCRKATEGDRATVIRWAQDHFGCAPLAPPEPAAPPGVVGRIEDLPRNPDGTVTIPLAGTWTWGDPS